MTSAGGSADSPEWDSVDLSSLPQALAGVVRMAVALSEVGVEIGEPSGQVTPDAAHEYARIGAVVMYDDGLVEAVPCTDATMEQMGEVVRQAEIARADGPVGEWWQRIAGLGWEASVYEPISVVPRRVW
ncbi:hypothetical protein [Nocardia brasiliensis]|uniref:hypothetical protein n=1 Tax=Nocardia brasiliensis TaxID=37326 RepID=UPI0024585E8B|nr:hypothetical protein [Nocardia brasiliensis]